MPVSIRLPRNGFITNTQRTGGGCADNVVVIHDRSLGKTHQLRQYNWRNGRPTAQKYNTWDIRGLGHGTRRGRDVGTAASGVAGLFGVLRGHEINTPGYRIEHALHIGGCRASRAGAATSCCRARSYCRPPTATGAPAAAA